MSEGKVLLSAWTRRAAEVREVKPGVRHLNDGHLLSLQLESSPLEGPERIFMTLLRAWSCDSECCTSYKCENLRMFSP